MLGRIGEVRMSRRGAVADTLTVRSTVGAVEILPEPGRVVRFGRGGEEVDLRVGTGDLGVSRRHGELTFRDGHWWLRNTGQRLLRLASRAILPEQLEPDDEPIALARGHTQVYVTGSESREYAVDLYVFDGVPAKEHPSDARTVSPKRWELTGDEKLVLVVMGQRYLSRAREPRPLTYRETAVELMALSPEKAWDDAWVKKRRELTADQFLTWLERRVERTLETVRKRLARQGFPYVLESEPGSGRRFDDGLKRNLFNGLIESTTLGKADLDLLEEV